MIVLVFQCSPLSRRPDRAPRLVAAAELRGEARLEGGLLLAQRREVAQERARRGDLSFLCFFLEELRELLRT